MKGASVRHYLYKKFGIQSYQLHVQEIDHEDITLLQRNCAVGSRDSWWF